MNARVRHTYEGLLEHFWKKCFEHSYSTGTVAKLRLRNARAMARWEELEEQGLVRLRFESDDCCDVADLLYCEPASEYKSKGGGRRFENERRIKAVVKSEKERLERDGARIIIGEHRKPECAVCGRGEEWVVDCSIGGYIGDDCYEQDNVLDVKLEVMAALEKEGVDCK